MRASADFLLLPARLLVCACALLLPAAQAQAQQAQPRGQLGRGGVRQDEVRGPPVALDDGGPALLQHQQDRRAVHGARQQLAQGPGPPEIAAGVEEDGVGGAELPVGGGHRGQALDVAVEEGRGGQDVGGVVGAGEHHDAHQSPPFRPVSAAVPRSPVSVPH